MADNSIYRSRAGAEAIMAFYDTTLARWPVAHQPLNVPTRHGDTFVIACGDEAAPPLILLHGAGTNSTMWGADIATYSRDHRVYAVDLLGEPGKSSPNRPAWEGPAYAEWLEDILAELRIDRARLVGLSQGGWTALKFAVYQPRRVEKLALLTPGGVVPDKTSFLFAAVFYMLLGQWGVRRMMKMLYGSQTVPDGVAEITMLFMRHFKSRMGVLPIFTDAELRRLTMPTLLLVGSQDALRDGDKIAARLQQHLPDFTAEIIPGGGHALLDTVDRVAAFLGKSVPVA